MCWILTAFLLSADPSSVDLDKVANIIVDQSLKDCVFSKEAGRICYTIIQVGDPCVLTGNPALVIVRWEQEGLLSSPALTLQPAFLFYLPPAVAGSSRSAGECRQLVAASMPPWASQEGIWMVLHHPNTSTPLPVSHPDFIPPSCSCGATGREQTSWPERLPEEPAEPAAAGVQGQRGSAHPLTAGVDLLRHLHLQHLRLPEGKELEQEHPAAAA